MSNIDFAYIISHGFAARMVLQTDLLKRLADVGFKVAIITTDKTDENLLEYSKSYNITLVEYNVQSTRWSGEYFNLRKYIFEDINQNPALLEKHIRGYQTTKGRSLLSHLKIRFYYFLYKFTKFIPQVKFFFEIYERFELKDPQAQQILEALDPRHIIATYPVSLMEGRLLSAANRREKTTTIIHLLSWDNITCKGRFPQLADYYISWGEIMTAELGEYYNIHSDLIYESGVPHFDIHHEVLGSKLFKELLKEKGLNPEVPYLFFAMSSPYFAPGEIEIVEWLAKQIIEDGFGTLNLIIRPHPQNVAGDMADITWIKRLRNLESCRVAIDWPRLSSSKLNWSMQSSDMNHLADILEGCSVSLNSGSTVIIDSLCHRKPVILTLFDANQDYPWWKSVRRVGEFKHLAKVINSGAVLVANDFSQLSDLITELLTYPDLNIGQRMALLEKECYSVDGTATENVISALREIYHITQPQKLE